MKLALAVLVALAVWATPAAGQCVPNPATDLQVTVSPSPAPFGVPVTVTVKNVSTTCTYYQTSACLIAQVCILNCTGAVVRKYSCAEVLSMLPPGNSTSMAWDQKDNKGGQVAGGTYAFALNLTDEKFQDVDVCPKVIVSACLPTQYGQGSAGAGGQVPALASAGGDAQLGNTQFQLLVVNAVGGTQSILFLGLGQGNVATGWGTFLIDPVLPFFQLPIPIGGVPGAPGAGSVTLGVPIPNNPALVGVKVYFQMLIQDAASTGGISTTNGLELKFCQ